MYFYNYIITTNIRSIQQIVFDRVVTNAGGAHNVHLGSFVAPVTVIYVFSTTLLSYPGYTKHFQFAKNNDFASRMFLHTSQIRNADPGEEIHDSNFYIFADFLMSRGVSPKIALNENAIIYSGELRTIQQIVFDRVVTNAGGAHNVHLGSFVAPVTVIYVFSTTLLSYPGYTKHFQFAKNNDFASRMFLHTSQIRNADPGEEIHDSNFYIFADFLMS
ncbi:hypothetical protein MAR_013002 [Mya arenaria]|uniref:C1q domain-containing protein n=1 Tax=Mya arenaria TaxID=6604 RepID=A0ABY7FYL7_MYAAR|nr:hypothetical protein MAR_013002 [Mya arenaria]